MEFVRGIMLYGYGAQDEGLRVNTRPFLQWKGVVMQVKHVPSNFAVGYYSTYVTSRPTDIGGAGMRLCGWLFAGPEQSGECADSRAAVSGGGGA